MIKRFFAILFCLSLLLSTAAWADGGQDSGDALLDEERLCNIDQSAAIIAYWNLLSTIECDSEGNYAWPSDYGGAFINDDAKLVIYVKDLDETKHASYADRCQEDIITVNAEYSKNELCAVCEAITTHEIDIEFDFVGVNEVTNKLDLYIPGDVQTYSADRSTNELTEEYPFVNIINKSLEESLSGDAASRPTPYLTISSGSKIYGENGYFTLGIWAKLSNGTKGFITAGHSFTTNKSFDSSLANVYTSSVKNTVLGTASSSKWADSGAYDCAFITLTSSLYTPTTGFISGGTIASIKNLGSSLPANTWAYKYGAGSGLAYGQVTYTTETAYDDHKNFYVLNYGTSGAFGSGADGDSGGPVYALVNNVRYLEGFVMAGKGTDIQYFTNAQTQLTKLGATIYTG